MTRNIILNEAGEHFHPRVVEAFEAAEKINNEAWDIFGGRAEDKGIRVVIDPVSQQKDVLYDYSKDSTDMLIIRYAGDPEAEEMMRRAGG